MFNHYVSCDIKKQIKGNDPWMRVKEWRIEDDANISIRCDNDDVSFLAWRFVLNIIYWTSQCRFVYGEFGISLQKIETWTDLLHSSASNNETKKQGSVGSTMYKANLQRCRSVTLCISRFASRFFVSASFICTQCTLFELYGFCGFSISLPLTRTPRTLCFLFFFCLLIST